ncbi:peroxidase 25 [Amborella trichopoda]|nr:peroxidase 25 [Amborella trichopoda]|eukprot:XP_006842561.2 peroxidase 25 [Amborella trichopoda]
MGLRMAISRAYISFLSTFFILFLLRNNGGVGATTLGYYSESCPNVEEIVKSSVEFFVSNDNSLAPALLRLHFHDCFVHGCDGSVLLEGSSSEMSAPANTGLRGFQVIMDAKAGVEARCPGVVSCADILALAARDAVVLTKGPSWEVALGRLDGLKSSASDTNDMPSPFDSISLLATKFAAKGLSLEDLVALSGAHTIGQADCHFFSYRLYNYGTTGASDPSLNSSSLNELKAICPSLSSNNRAALDKGSRQTWDNAYYKNIGAGNALLESDSKLGSDGSTGGLVSRFAGSLSEFDSTFVRSMVKLGNVGVKTKAGGGGEIRRMCQVTNF